MLIITIISILFISAICFVVYYISSLAPGEEEDNHMTYLQEKYDTVPFLPINLQDGTMVQEEIESSPLLENGSNRSRKAESQVGEELDTLIKFSEGPSKGLIQL